MFSPGHALDPYQRTLDGEPLGEADRELLLECTDDDVHIATQWGQQVTAKLGKLADALGAQAELERRYGQPGDSFEAVLARMPASKRRRARELQHTIARLQEWHANFERAQQQAS